MSGELVLLVKSLLDTLSSPLSEADLLKLGLALGRDLLKEASDLLDRNQVTRVTGPNSHSLTLVSGTSTRYTVHGSLTTASLPLGYCPCPALALLIFSPGEENVHPPKKRALPMCKHLLAARLAEHLGAEEQRVATLGFLASWATNFTQHDAT